jgi:hypothetical protein
MGGNGNPIGQLEDGGAMYDMGGGEDEGSWMAAPDAVGQRGVSRRTAEDIASFKPLTLERGLGGSSGAMDVAPNHMTDEEIGMYDTASAETAGLTVQDNNMYDMAATNPRANNNSAAPVYVAQTLSDENAGGLYDTADDDNGAIVAPIPREDSAQSGNFEVSEHSFGEVVTDMSGTSPRAASIVNSTDEVGMSQSELAAAEAKRQTKRTAGASARRTTSWDAPAAPGGEQDVEAQWSPVEMDPSSNEFRMKSVRRSNPLAAGNNDLF